MSVELPPLMDRAQLAERCGDVANRVNLSVASVEKDYYLTRVLCALGQKFGASLLLKGGTLLSKVDLGFRRAVHPPGSVAAPRTA